MAMRWMAEISYRTGHPTSLVTFEEIAELQEIVEHGPNWNGIEQIVVTLNRSSVELAPLIPPPR